MKHLLLLFIGQFIYTIACGQISYYDAIKLKREDSIGTHTYDFDSSGRILLTQNNAVFKILKYYVPDSDTSDKHLLMNGFEDNPFMHWAGTKPHGNVVSSGAPSFLSSIGGIDVTNIANGIAMLMIDRAKKELTVTFFNRFKKFVEDRQEFRVLFPKTTGNLSNLLAYKYPEMLPALRTGFFEDLKNITFHLDDVLELPRYNELLKNFPEMRMAIRSVRLIHGIESGDMHPADVLTQYAAFDEWTDSLTNYKFQNFGSTIKLAAIFSNSLRDSSSLSKDPDRKKDSAKAWISFKNMQELVKDKVAFRIYLGLIYQLAKKENIHWQDDKITHSFTSIMDQQKDNVFLFENKVTEFITLAEKADKIIDTLKQKNKNKIELTKDDYYSYINASLDIIEYGFSISDVFVTSDKRVISDYANIAYKSNDLYRHIYKEEYTQAVSNAMDILGGVVELINSNKENLADSIKRRYSITTLDTAKINAVFRSGRSLSKVDTVLLNKSIALITSSGQLRRLNDFIVKTTRYGLFMANIVDAKKPEEVQAVLENVILPVGSSSIKKNTQFNISVQSYLGAYMRVGSESSTLNTSWTNKFGISAPVGIAVSHGFSKYGSVSLFLPLFDIGAIVDYQLKKDSTVGVNGQDSSIIKKDYQIKLGQIISPGVYLVYGFLGNIPLSIGIGGQYGPGLGKIDTKGTVINNPSWRWNMFLSVDIPFFNLFNSNKKYQLQKKLD
ncbi:hypothetical protein [Chitinophaga sp. MM2321]|uniref:hypothetical protein n=1 Tax=Chitinophaga sp. MM2321 TaxID=3137178 RepID=UPI0032D5998E